MIVEMVELDNGTAMGISLQMQNAPLLLIRAKRGFVMCGYLDLEAAASLGDLAVKLKGVKTIEDMLGAPVAGVTSAAAALGIKQGMTGKEALELMC